MFHWPAGWPLLGLVPVVWGVVRWRDRSRTRRVEHIAGPRAATLAAEVGRRRRGIRRALYGAGMAAALIALLQPAWGIDDSKLDQRGVDMIICLDVSRSMLARDMTPSRLAHAQNEIRALARRARGDRFGLVVFAGEARLAVPLTRDGETFADLADLADPLSVGRGGTDLGAALDSALVALEGSTGDQATILLLTDGEDLEARGVRAARECSKRGITVHAIGMGSTLGSKIAIQEDGSESFLRDRGGEDVVSAMNPDALRAIADATGGVFIDANESPRPLLEVYEKRVTAMTGTSTTGAQRSNRGNRYQWVLLVAFILWMAALSLSERRRAI